jgi:hypothetical protein
MSGTDQLRKLVEERHHILCTFIREDTVHEESWSGKVHIFSCTDNPAMLVYAWAEGAAGAERAVTIPAKDGIRSARDAVRAHLGGMIG